jgi:hypothetical protein
MHRLSKLNINNDGGYGSDQLMRFDWHLNFSLFEDAKPMINILVKILNKNRRSTLDEVL